MFLWFPLNTTITDLSKTSLVSTVKYFLSWFKIRFTFGKILWQHNPIHGTRKKKSKPHTQPFAALKIKKKKKKTANASNLFCWHNNGSWTKIHFTTEKEQLSYLTTEWMWLNYKCARLILRWSYSGTFSPNYFPVCICQFLTVYRSDRDVLVNICFVEKNRKIKHPQKPSLNLSLVLISTFFCLV